MKICFSIIILLLGFFVVGIEEKTNQKFRSVSADKEETQAKILSSMYQKCVLISGKNGRGTGFFVCINEVNYIVTCNHVIMEIEDPIFRDIQGNKYFPNRIISAIDRDLAFLELRAIDHKNYNSIPCFELAEDMSSLSIGTDLICIGDSEGQGVLVECRGVLNGIGPKLFETSCPFVPGNSGGPIIELNSGKVYGVATFIRKLDQSYLSIGTRFNDNSKNQARRFAVRVDNIKFSTKAFNLSSISLDRSRYNHMMVAYQKSLTIHKSQKKYSEKRDEILETLIMHKMELPFIPWNTCYYASAFYSFYPNYEKLLLQYGLSPIFEDKNWINWENLVFFNPQIVLGGMYDYQLIKELLSEGIFYPNSRFFTVDHDFGIIHFILSMGTYNDLCDFIKTQSVGLFGRFSAKTPSMFSYALMSPRADTTAKIEYLLKKGLKLSEAHDKNSLIKSAVNAKDKLKIGKYFLDDKFEVIKLMLNNGVNLDAKTKDTILYDVSDVRIAQLLIDHGANPQYIPSNGFSLLHQAVKEQNVVLLQFLLHQGIDINAMTTKKITYFDKSKKATGDNFFEMLANNHSIYNAKSTPLACAVDSPEDSTFKIVKLLVEHGADINAVDAEGKSILDRTCNQKVRDYLISKGAK